MQKANVTKTSSDQFAKIFADNAVAQNQADIAKRQNLAKHSELASPPQHAHRIGVDEYRKRHEPVSQAVTDESAAKNIDQPKPALDAQKASEPKAETSAKKSSAVTENPDLKDQEDFAHKSGTISVAPVLALPLPVFTTDITATIDNAQLALAATVQGNITSLINTDITVEDATAANKKALANLEDLASLKDLTSLKDLASLKTMSQNSPASLMLQAFSKTDAIHSSDKLFDDLLSLQPQVMSADEQALIADFKGAFDKSLPMDIATQQMLHKFEALSSIGGKNAKDLLVQPTEILKTAFGSNTDLFALPLGNVFGASFSTVNDAAKHVREASVAASTATLASLPVSIASRALKGAREFTIHLYPAELGKVDIKMEINDKGEIKANLRVERPETLAMLQRDSSALNRSLEQAGFKPSSDSLQFSLYQDNAHHKHAQTDWSETNTGRPAVHVKSDHTSQSADITAAVVNAYARRNNSAVDIHI